MFFDGWDSVARITLLAAATYIVLVAALRVIGEQALAKMSSYDMIVTIALGSLLVSIPLGSDITLTDGLAAIAAVLLLQEATRFLVKRSRRASQVIRQHPHLVLWDGHLLRQRMDELNVLEEEVRAAVRRGGLGSLAEAQAVVLETDGEWSVVPRQRAGDLSALTDFEEVSSTRQ
jgi:uncharacterized membrane protein YcaP (DUF421 family)